MSRRTAVNLTDYSVSVNTQDVFVLPNNPPRNFLCLKNNGPSACAVSFNGSAAGTNATGSVMLAANAAPLIFQKAVPQSAIHAKSAGTSVLTVQSDDSLPGTGLPFWILNQGNPPEVDLDFMHQRYFKSGTILSSAPVSVTRSTVGYANDVSGTWTQFAANVARITNLGVLVEEGRTNGVQNNSMQGAVVGTIGGGGAYPTNWSNQASRGLTQTIIGTGTELGIDYIDIRFSGVPTGSGDVRTAFEAVNQIAALNGQTWSLSVFVKIAAGDLTNISGVNTTQFFRDAGGVALTNQDTAITVTSSLTRFRNIFTATNASTAFVEPELQFDVTIGLAVDVTFRIGWPQEELGAFPTSPIRTTTVAVARSADVITLSSPPTFGTSFSYFAQGTTNIVSVAATSPRIAAAYIDGNNIAETQVDRTTGVTAINLYVGGPNIYSVSCGATNVIGTSVKTSHALAPSRQRGAAGGTLSAAQTANPIFTPTSFSIGMEINTAQWNGFVERIAIWPTIAISDATQQSITT